MSIGTFALSETPVADQSTTKRLVPKPPPKRQYLPKSDAVAAPEPR